jgi:hypothetical protein
MSDNDRVKPALEERGREALRILSRPGPITLAEGLAKALLEGAIQPPTEPMTHGGQ